MNVPHTERAAGDEPSDFYAATVEADFHSPQIITQDMSGRMRMLSKWLIEEYYQMAPGKTALMQAFMRAFLAEYQRVSSQHRSELVETVHAYLRKNLDQRLTVTQIARQVNMSRAHFMRLYKRLTGKTPMEVLRTLRVEAARDLIITTDQPLRSIAPQVGFCDQYQLSRVFRKLLQVTPGHFRRQACSGTGTER
jgi:AraC-like DNA-binding protein